MGNYALEIAARMLRLPGPARVPADLLRRIRRVESFVERAGGELISRQVIANMVVQWEEDDAQCRAMQDLKDWPQRSGVF